MKPFRLLGEGTAPDGIALALYEHDGDYLIRANGADLMSTRRHHSEVVLAQLACAPLADVAGVRVLVGGLGLGFTLKAALGVLGPDARVVVAEIAQVVIDWNLNPAYPLAREALSDPRVELCHADVADVLARRRGGFDAVMLDVDNGPEALTTATNTRLYRSVGVAQAMASLRPGGRLAYWSAGDDPEFESTLRQAGLSVSVTQARAHISAGPLHTLYVAQLSHQGSGR